MCKYIYARRCPNGEFCKYSHRPQLPEPENIKEFLIRWRDSAPKSKYISNLSAKIDEFLLLEKDAIESNTLQWGNICSSKD